MITSTHSNNDAETLNVSASFFLEIIFLEKYSETTQDKTVTKITRRDLSPKIIAEAIIAGTKEIMTFSMIF